MLSGILAPAPVHIDKMLSSKVAGTYIAALAGHGKGAFCRYRSEHMRPLPNERDALETQSHPKGAVSRMQAGQ